jgi:cyanophycinase-like exopeptidase
METGFLILAGGALSYERKLAILDTYHYMGVQTVVFLSFLSEYNEIPFPDDTRVKYQLYSDPLQIDLRKFTGCGLFINGGNQFLIEEFDRVYLKKLFGSFMVVGGTSAGAMVLGSSYYGEDVDGEFKIREGLGFVDFFVDTHFYERGRYSRFNSVRGAVVGVNEDSFVTVKLRDS